MYIYIYIFLYTLPFADTASAPTTQEVKSETASEGEGIFSPAEG